MFQTAILPSKNGLLLIGEYVIDNVSGLLCFNGIGIPVFGKRYQGLPYGPATTARPGRIVERQRSSERSTACT
jgi:hypothetical protein